MASEPPLDPGLRAQLQRELGAVGRNVLDLERALRDAGFHGVEVANDTVRSLAESPEALAAFDRSRQVVTARRLENPLDFSTDGLTRMELKLRERGSTEQAYATVARFREVFEEEAARFAAPLQDRGSFRSKEDRIHALKWAGAQCGMVVSTAPGLAETRAIVGLQVRHRLSIVGALSGVHSMAPLGEFALVDWRVGLIANDIGIAMKRRLDCPRTHVPVDLPLTVRGLRLYMHCRSLPQIATATGAMCVAIRWCAEQLAKEHLDTPNEGIAPPIEEPSP